MEVRDYYQAKAQGYGGLYTTTYEGYPSNQKRLELILRRLKEIRPVTLLDCGCGEGTPMRRIQEAGVQAWGFDFASEMVEQAKANLLESGLQERVWCGDITDPASFRPPGIRTPESWDVCIAAGVFPHLEDDQAAAALTNLAGVLRPGGRVFIEFRNALFSLFTLNRYSYAFFSQQLVQFEELKRRHPEHRAELEQIQTELSRFFRTDLPAVQRSTEAKPSFDDILARFHQDEEVVPFFARFGFQVVRRYFYHLHALPPLFEPDHPELFQKLSLEMEGNTSQARGRFMASAFIVEAILERSS